MLMPPEFSVKGIMFDLDGTLLDTRPAYIETARIAFEETGQQPPEVKVALEIPKRIERKQNIKDIIMTDTSEFLEVYLETFYRISASKTQPFPCVANALEVLSQQTKLAVITMRFVSGNSVIKELQQFKLNRYFSQVVTGLDTHKPKPSPEALKKAVAAMNVEISECLIVGDSVVDVEAGKAAGSKTVAVLTGLYSRDELEKASPDLIINNISELAPLIFP